MPTLSIIKLGNKCAYSHTGQQTDITRMLTQCAFQDELLAQAITQSAMNISQKRISVSEFKKTNNNPEISQR